jgi:UDPglucose 6-dehydrogenase
VLTDVERPVVAVLGLTYKPGTSTLRRSAAVELCRDLAAEGISIRAFDPAVAALPDDLADVVQFCGSAADALWTADVAVVATEWPEFRNLTAEMVVAKMRRPQIIDQNHFLAATLANRPDIVYLATGRPARTIGLSQEGKRVA